MFTARLPPVNYLDPWSEPLRKRVKEFRRGKLKVAYFYQRPDASTFRYRVHNMVRELANVGSDLSASYFTYDDGDFAFEVMEAADVLVMVRAHYDVRVDRLIRRVSDLGATVLFDVDDLIFDVRHLPLMMSSVGQNLRNPLALSVWFAEVGRQYFTLGTCHGAITTNQFLADRIRDCVPIPVGVVPNFLHTEQIGISDHLLSLKRKSNYGRDGLIHIGYFSGTPTHERDFAIAAPAIADLMDEDSRLRLCIVGCLDLQGPIQRHANRVVMHPLTDFVNLQRLISSVEINIAPLQDNLFTNCKSQLKYFEAAVVGTITVATPTYPFASSIQDGCNGLLARSWEWHAKLREAIRMIDDGRYVEMAERARVQAMEAFGPGRHGDPIERLLRTMASRPVDEGIPNESIKCAAWPGEAADANAA